MAASLKQDLPLNPIKEYIKILNRGLIMLFPFSLFSVMVYASLFLTALGATTLLVLLAIDFMKKKIW